MAISDRILGPGELTLRLPFLIGGTLLIPATYAAGRLLFNPKAGLFASIVVALSPIHISYSQIARVYALLPLLALATAVTLHYLIHRQRKMDMLLHGLALAATIWCHQWGVLLIPAAYLALYLTGYTRRIHLLLIAHTLAFALCTPLLPAARPNPHQADIVASFYEPVWKSTSPALLIPRSVENLWAGGEYSSHTTMKIHHGQRDVRHNPRNLRLKIYAAVPPFFWRLTCWATLFLLLFTALVPRWDRSDRGRWMGNARILLLLSLATPLVLALLFSLIVTPIYLLGRHDLMVLPFLALLAGLGASRYSSKGIAFVSITYALLAASTLIPFYAIEMNDGNRARADHLLRITTENDVILYTGYRQSPIEYYMRPHAIPCPSLAFPTDIHNWRAGLPLKKYQEDPTILPRDAHETTLRIQSLLSTGGSLYVVPAGGDFLKILAPHLEASFGEPQVMQIQGGMILRY